MIYCTLPEEWKNSWKPQSVRALESVLRCKEQEQEPEKECEQEQEQKLERAESGFEGGKAPK